MKEIKAREGYYLTQRAEVEDRIFLKAIKGEGVNEMDWREATTEETQQFEKAEAELKIWDA